MRIEIRILVASGSWGLPGRGRLGGTRSEGTVTQCIHLSKLNRNSHRLTHPTRIHEVVGSIPDLPQWVKDLVLP